MDEKIVQGLLIEILCVAVNETEPDEELCRGLTPETLLSVYRLAKKHDLAHVVSHFIYQNSLEVDPSLREKLEKEEILSVYRHEQMSYTFEEICRLFTEASIPYVPLKGAVIRPYYPYESMRTSCDIDILIREKDLADAVALLESKGYECGEKNYHDISLHSPNRIHLELHFSIQENLPSLDRVLKDAWSYTEPVDGCRYRFTKEFFVFHMYAHMAYHFHSGGCGIRSLVDLWIMEHKMNASVSCGEELLKKAGIDQFAKEISKLADECFSTGTRNEFSELVLSYIFSGGVYGSAENSIAVRKSKGSSTLSYLLRRLFLPYRTMVITYPILKKIPLLLPFCWVARWIGGLFGGKTKKISAEMACANRISEEKLSEVKELRARLGLHL